MIGIYFLNALLISILISLIFAAHKYLKWQSRNRQNDMDNTYKIFLRRAEQLAYVFTYEIQPDEIFPNSMLMRFVTPAGELYVKYKPGDVYRRSKRTEIGWMDDLFIGIKLYGESIQ